LQSALLLVISRLDEVEEEGGRSIRRHRRSTLGGEGPSQGFATPGYQWWGATAMAASFPLPASGHEAEQQG